MTAIDMNTNIEEASGERALWSEKLPTFLRAVGASAVLFSLYGFLFKGWEGSSDLIRYSMLLAHTVLLAVIALGSGHFFREGKGPRLMMMLALVSVPVNFAILGAFVGGAYLSMHSEIPSYVFWHVGDLTTALVISGVAAVCLVPVVMLAFRTLVRGLSRPMTILFLIANVALLIPVRDAFFASIVPLVIASITLFFSVKTARQRTEAKTFEGMIALLLMFVPSGIMLGRDFWLHHQEASMLVAAGIMMFIVLRHIAIFFNRIQVVQTFCEIVAMIVAFFTGVCLSIALADMGVISSFGWCFGALATSAMIYEIASRKTALSQMYRVFAAGYLALACGANLLAGSSVWTSLFCVAVGIACVVYSHRAREKSLLILGVALICGGAAEQLWVLIAEFDFTYWPAMAVSGVAAIVFASLIESRGTQLKNTVKRYGTHYMHWEF